MGKCSYRGKSLGCSYRLLFPFIVFYVPMAILSIPTTFHLFFFPNLMLLNHFCHYLLGNNFMLFVDHQALIYSINKPIVIRWITQWLLLLQEFNFKVIYTLRKVNFVPNQLSCVKNGKLVVGVWINYLTLFSP
jgi:hypothetical protein